MTCKKCKKELKRQELIISSNLTDSVSYGGGGAGGNHQPSLTTTKGEFYYCENQECEHFAILKKVIERHEL